MQTANELLYGILQVVGKIEQNTRTGKSAPSGVGSADVKTSKASQLSNLGGALASFKDVKPKSVLVFSLFMNQILKIAEKSGKNSKKLSDLSSSINNLGQGLPGLASGLDQLGKIKVREVERSIHGLGLLYNFMSEMGDGRKTAKIDRAVKTFEKIGKSLQEVAKPIKDISLGFAYLGLGILAFAGSLLLTAMILKMSSPTDVLIFVGVTVFAIVGMFALLSQTKKYTEEGSKNLKQMGIALASLSMGILAFAISMLLTSMALKATGWMGVLIFVGVTVLAMVSMFLLLSLTKKYTEDGIKTTKQMGIAMVFLSLGILAFSLTLRLVTAILGKESGGSIVKSMLIMVSVVAAASLMFGIMGVFDKAIAKGVMTATLMSLGMIILSVGIIALATTSKYLMGGALSLKSDKTAAAERDQNKSMILRGLGMIGLIILGAIATFSILGFASEIIIPGTIVAILMGVAMLVLAKSITKLVQAGEALKGKDVRGLISNLIGGTLGGFIDGLSVMSEGKTGFSAIGAFIKNSAKIFAGTAVLMSMSLALSMFARAITAFAELENMRIIEGYDKDGKPIFGEKVNITQVANNITYTISTFLSALLASTETLTKDKAVAIRKMGRALTGRRGILSAVIQFADAMKVYAEFGEKNEIGYIDYDDKGKEIRKKVSAKKVVDNMIGSFLYFTNALFNRSDEEFGDGEEKESGISGRQKRRMKRMGKALVGRNGILGAVMQFADTLKTFAEFGESNSIPILDAEGKPVMAGGKPKMLSIDKIANNIVLALTTFSDTLATKLEGSNPKDAKKAIERYSGIIEELSKFSESLSSLEKVNDTITNLAKSINDLSVSLDGFDQVKLQKLSSISGVAAESAKNMPESGSGGSSERTVAIKNSPSYSHTQKEEDWNQIASIIGAQVGAQLVEAMKKGHVKFEFSPTGQGQGVMNFS